MRVAVVSPVVSGVSGGYRKYMAEVVPLLACDRRVKRIDVFTGPAVAHLHDLDESLITTWPANDPLRGFPWLKSHIRETGYDVVFIPTAFWLDCGRVPVVMMVRNTEPLMVPFAGNSVIDGFKNIMRARFARQACRNADRVIAVSQHVMDYLAERWRIDSAKVGVVCHGVEQSVPESEMVEPDMMAAPVGGRFIFTAGSVRPARGLEDIIAAMAALRHSDDSLRLAIAGKVDDGAEAYKRRLDALAARLGVTNSIIWLGHLDRRHIAWCYRHCEAFVMTSRAEACPNIALEAMSHGCQVVSTTQPPMPEFFKDYAVYYPPKDSGELARTIESVMSAPGNVKEARRRGAVGRAAEFDWHETARRTVGELEAAMESTARSVR